MRLAETSENTPSCTASVFDSLKAHIAILDSNCEILETNTAWCDFAFRNGMTRHTNFIGVNYVAVCKIASTEVDSDVRSPAALHPTSKVPTP